MSITSKRKAQELVREGKIHDAIGKLREALIEGDADPYDHVYLGDLLMRVGETEDCLSAYQKAIRSYEDVGLYRNAVAIGKKMLRIDAKRPEIHRCLASLYDREGLHGEAIPHYLTYLDSFVGEEVPPTEFLETLDQAAAITGSKVEVALRLSEHFVRIRRGDRAAALLEDVAANAETAGSPEMAGDLRQRARQLSGVVDDSVSVEPELPTAEPLFSFSAGAPEEDDADRVEAFPPPLPFAATPLEPISLDAGTLGSAFDSGIGTEFDTGIDSGATTPDEHPILDLDDLEGLADVGELAAEPSGFSLPDADSEDFGSAPFSRPSAESEDLGTAPPARAARGVYDVGGAAGTHGPARTLDEAFGMGRPHEVDFGSSPSARTLDDALGFGEVDLTDSGDRSDFGSAGPRRFGLDADDLDLAGESAAGRSGVDSPGTDLPEDHVYEIDLEEGPGFDLRPVEETPGADSRPFGGPGAPETPSAKADPPSFPGHSSHAATSSGGASHAAPFPGHSSHAASPGSSAGSAGHPSVTIEEANDAFLAGRWSEARRLYEHLLEDQPENRRILARLVETVRYLQDPQGEVHYLVLLGEVWIAEDELEEALECFLKVVRLDPENSTAKRRLSRFREMHVRGAEVIEEADSNSVHGVLETGRTEIQVRDGEESFRSEDWVELEGLLEEFKEGLKTQMDDADYQGHYDLAVAYHGMGLLEEALDAADRVLACQGVPEAITRQAIELKGSCLTELHRYREAVHEYREAVEKAGTDRQARRTALYHLARSLEALEEWQEAVDTYVQLRLVAPGFLDVEDRMRSCESRLGASSSQPPSEAA
jgi:tetratricopeptide (TPR) repeat protein